MRRISRDREYRLSRPIPTLDFSCVVCGKPATSLGSKTCGSAKCVEALPNLSRAIWEGHLLRNNVDVKD